MGDASAFTSRRVGPTAEEIGGSVVGAEPIDVASVG